MVKEVFDERLPPEFARKVIAGLEAVRWGGGERENSVIGALAAALGSIGEDVPYEFLMGVSGGAFRIQVAQPDWCPSSPHANCGFRLYPPLAEALPYELVPAPAEPSAEGEEGPRRAPRALLDSIDRGVPAFYSKEEESLVVGYDKEGAEVLLRPYAAPKEGYVPEPVDKLLSSWGGFEVLRRKDEAPDRRASLVRSLEIAVELAHTPSYEKYASGFNAYIRWIEQLRDASERGPGEMLANGHGFYSLVDARAAAAAYLESIGPELGGEAAEGMARAAPRYSEIAKVLTRRSPTEVAPMPWMLKPGQSWTHEQRNEQADLLAEELELERRAVGELERALEVLKRS